MSEGDAERLFIKLLLHNKISTQEKIDKVLFDGPDEEGGSLVDLAIDKGLGGQMAILKIADYIHKRNLKFKPLEVFDEDTDEEGSSDTFFLIEDNDSQKLYLPDDDETSLKIDLDSDQKRTEKAPKPESDDDTIVQPFSDGVSSPKKAPPAPEPKQDETLPIPLLDEMIYNPTEAKRRFHDIISKPIGAGLQLADLLNNSRNLGASDLHISPGSPVYYRKNGLMQRSKTSSLSHEDIEKMIFDVLSVEQGSRLVEDHKIKLCLNFESGKRYRASIFKEQGGWSGHFHILASSAPSLDTLGLPAQVKKLCEAPQGLLFVTGPSGCGKTSTITAMVSHIQQKRKAHIVTIEEPCEFRLSPQSGLMTQRSVGVHSLSYTSALKGAIREGADTIVLGELSGPELILMALRAAESGCLLLAPLPCKSSTESLRHLVWAFPENQRQQIWSMLSRSLIGVVYQELLPTMNEKGRALALELLINHPSMSEALLAGEHNQFLKIIRTHQEDGMIYMVSSVRDLLRDNKISHETSNNFLPVLNKI